MRSARWHVVIVALSLTCWTHAVPAAETPSEDDYYKILRYTIPEGVVLEPGGLEVLPNGRLAVASRRGDFYMVSNAFEDDPAKAQFKLWAGGLHEVLGLAYRDGWLYATQRGEITKIRDEDGDGRADVFLTVTDEWGISGDYHEYAFGSPFDRDGYLWVVLCLTGSFNSNVPYRGWCVRVAADGTMLPTASGIRSPGGIGMNCAGDVFYTDNQGPWNGTSSLKHLVPGSFQSHPAGNRWYELPTVNEAVGARPQDPVDKSRFHLEAARTPEFVPPPVLLPHGKVGNSASGITCDASDGKFGPFSGQLFVSDQSFSVINRVVLEKIDGRYQGVVIPFRRGFASGNVPQIQAPNGSFVVGGTSRGWGSRGGKQFALERLVWTGNVPFEILEMRVSPQGFVLEFTEPVDPKTASDPASYAMQTYTYFLQSAYGSPEIDHSTPTIQSAKVSSDKRTVELIVEGRQIGHVHELNAPGVRSAVGAPLLHSTAYYTLWKMPK